MLPATGWLPVPAQLPSGIVTETSVATRLAKEGSDAAISSVLERAASGLLCPVLWLHGSQGRGRVRALASPLPGRPLSEQPLAPVSPKHVRPIDPTPSLLARRYRPDGPRTSEGSRRLIRSRRGGLSGAEWIAKPAKLDGWPPPGVPSPDPIPEGWVLRGGVDRETRQTRRVAELEIEGAHR